MSGQTYFNTAVVSARNIYSLSTLQLSLQNSSLLTPLAITERARQICASSPAETFLPHWNRWLITQASQYRCGWVRWTSREQSSPGNLPEQRRSVKTSSNPFTLRRQVYLSPFFWQRFRFGSAYSTLPTWILTIDLSWLVTKRFK